MNIELFVPAHNRHLYCIWAVESQPQFEEEKSRANRTGQKCKKTMHNPEHRADEGARDFPAYA